MDPAPGLLAAGGQLDTITLLKAYRSGIFPWFSQGDPLLWWSTDPRMVLDVQQFRMHTSLRKQLNSLLRQQRLELRFDHDFKSVIIHCATVPRMGHGGTWILHEMVTAYTELHQAGHAHSVEAWIDGELAGGLYVVNTGSMVFGESMFSLQPNGSKIALAGLVAFCRANNLPIIDCQQQTRHLSTLGARPMARSQFVKFMTPLTKHSPPEWTFSPLFWPELLSKSSV